MSRSTPLIFATAMVCAAGWLLGPPPATATTLMPVTLEEVAEAADLIVSGTVIASHGKFDPQRQMVFTHATLRVQEVLKGDLKAQVVQVIVPGGVDGETWSQVYGAPDPGFEGQDLVAFLYKERGNKMSNVVFWQGLYHVDGDEVRQTGESAAEFKSRVRDLLFAGRLQDTGSVSGAGTDRQVQR